MFKINTLLEWQSVNPSPSQTTAKFILICLKLDGTLSISLEAFLTHRHKLQSFLCVTNYSGLEKA